MAKVKKGQAPVVRDPRPEELAHVCCTEVVSEWSSREANWMISACWCGRFDFDHQPRPTQVQALVDGVQITEQDLPWFRSLDPTDWPDPDEPLSWFRVEAGQQVYTFVGDSVIVVEGEWSARDNGMISVPQMKGLRAMLGGDERVEIRSSDPVPDYFRPRGQVKDPFRSGPQVTGPRRPPRDPSVTEYRMTASSVPGLGGQDMRMVGKEPVPTTGFGQTYRRW